VPLSAAAWAVPPAVVDWPEMPSTKSVAPLTILYSPALTGTRVHAWSAAELAVACTTLAFVALLALWVSSGNPLLTLVMVYAPAAGVVAARAGLDEPDWSMTAKRATNAVAARILSRRRRRAWGTGRMETTVPPEILNECLVDLGLGEMY
jgi:hypothetical protein